LSSYRKGKSINKYINELIVKDLKEKKWKNIIMLTFLLELEA
jgi:hypothetical protein